MFGRPTKCDVMVSRDVTVSRDVIVSRVSRVIVMSRDIVLGLQFRIWACFLSSYKEGLYRFVHLNLVFKSNIVNLKIT